MKFRLLIIILFTVNSLIAQDKLTQFGLSFKPIFPSQYFRTGEIIFESEGTNFSVLQTSGYSVGALVRHNFNKRLAFETGIEYVKRNYDYKLKNDTFNSGSNFSMIAYEIPLNLLVFVQLGQQIYMSGGLGGSVDIFPSDIYTYDRDNFYFQQFTDRKYAFNTALGSNLGIEYRTKKSGTIYFGINYHRSFTNISRVTIEYYQTQDFDRLPNATGRTNLQGDYFTFDLRYYFHQDPERRKKKK